MLDQRNGDILESITDEFAAVDHQWRYTVPCAATDRRRAVSDRSLAGAQG
jgi:hypothetical protein